MRRLGPCLTALVATIALVVIVAIAIALAPATRRGVRDDVLGELTATARRLAPEAQRALAAGTPAVRLQALVRNQARQVDARVTLVGMTADGDPRVIADSRRAGADNDLRFGAATEAADDGAVRTAVESGQDGRVGQSAVPLGGAGGTVLVASRPLPNGDAIAAAIGRALIWPALIVLLLALASGLLAGRRLTRRITQLEQVARRVAAGEPGTPFPAGPADELGALARALEDMRIQLDELDSARKRFIATASHELRTPLFSLGGFLELIEDESVPEADRRRFVAQLRTQMNRLQQLATDLLDLSKMESGALELNESTVDLRELAREIAAEFEPRAGAHDAHIELRLAPDPLDARCDPERVRQVLRILVANALAHTPPGTDVVIAAARRGERPRLGVADYGPGIGRTVLPTIFEPFATTDDTQGTGLGLAIARELATRMSGELRVESRPGLTQFTLDLLPPASR